MLNRKIANASLFIAFLFLFGCAGILPTAEKGAPGIDGVECVGRVEEPPEGLVESEDESLLREALGASGKGMLCEGVVFQATEPVTVFRVWNKEKGYSLYGSWWSFDLPEGPKEKYREENGICPSWSALDIMSSCDLKVGTKVVVGPGQSADCEKMTIPKSPLNQVFIPNDSRNDLLFVENCTGGAAWP